jgi:hypothetical protein
MLRGGVYVNEPGAAPGPAGSSQDPTREIVTASGRRLVMLNPVAISREVFALQNRQNGIRGHITSLNPISAANAPDAWEQQALQELAKGRSEVSSTETIDRRGFFRLMRPLVLNATCLQCHEEQGRQIGSIRGGISVSVPLSLFTSPAESVGLAVAHGGLWLLGLTGLIFGARNLAHHASRLQQAQTERERLILELQDALANVKTLRGLIPICSSCKKIRNDEGSWTALETYLKQHSEAEFSHGLCADCIRKLYPDICDKVEERLAKNAAAAPVQKPQPPR